MEGRFPFAGGVLTVREQGGLVTLHMERTAGEGLYRGWLRGKGGRLDLGTLLPLGNRLTLDRKFPLERLKNQGCWPVTAGGADLSYAFVQTPPKPPAGWSWEDRPGRLFPTDPLLRERAAAAGRCLFSQKNDGFRLAWPWDERRPFPLPPVFCFGGVERIGEKTYLLFSFGGEGQPEMPAG